MKTCDEFQILMEREARGKISEQEEAELKEHLVRCTNCQRYALTVKLSKEVLSRPRQDMDWPIMMARVYAVERKLRWATVRIAAVAFALLALGLWLDNARFLRFAAGAAILTPSYLVLAGLRARKIARAAASRDDLIETYRTDLARSIKTFTLAIIFCGLSSAGWAAAGFYLGAEGPVLAVIFAVLAAIFWMKLERLKAERLQLA